MSTELTVHSGQALFRASTDAAQLCKAIVTATARKIQGRSYVQVEGWQAIATAHGCVASAGEVRRITDEGGAGYMAIGRVVRMDTGAEICSAEGFVGDDEKMWSGRPVYARRAMAQTRAISRACRSAFAHVVVMMQAGLETTPAEEVPPEGFEVQGEAVREQPRPEVPPPRTDAQLGEDYVSHVAGVIKQARNAADLSAIHDDAMAACKASGDREAAKRIKAMLRERKAQLEA